MAFVDETKHDIWVDLRRNPFCWMTGKPKIGENVWIGPYTVIDGANELLEIGDNSIISAGVQIYTHEMENVPGKEKKVPVREPTHIGKNVYIGANAVILRGCRIEDNAVIGACSLVKKGSHVGAKEVWVGIPAKKIKTLD